MSTVWLRFWNVYKKMFQKKLNPPSMRKVHIVLVQKRIDVGETPHVSVYRPVSLLSTNYTIFAKLLGRRLETGLHVVVRER